MKVARRQPVILPDVNDTADVLLQAEDFLLKKISSPAWRRMHLKCSSLVRRAWLCTCLHAWLRTRVRGCVLALHLLACVAVYSCVWRCSGCAPACVAVYSCAWLCTCVFWLCTCMCGCVLMCVAVFWLCTCMRGCAHACRGAGRHRSRHCSQPWEGKHLCAGPEH